MKQIEKKRDYLIYVRHTLKNFFGRGVAYLLVIICLEIICLSVLLFRGISSPKCEFDYAIPNFIQEGFPNVTTEGTNLVLSQAEGISDEQVQTVSSNCFSLSPGAYDLHISYESYTDGNGCAAKSTGEIALISKHHDIESDTLRFDDAHQTIVGRFWIPVFSNCDDLYFTIRYNGQGTLKVNSIHIAESRKYRVVVFLGVLGISLLIDLFLLLFFTDSQFKVNRRIAVIMAVVFVSSIPFLGDTLCIFGGQDLWFHLCRIVALSDSLSNGQIPVRIATEVNNGYGYPNSLYYCDIFLYLSAVLYQFRIPLRICYQFYAIIVNVFTGMFTYYAISKFTKREELRLLGTALYLLCSYRLANLIIRSAVGEYTAMSFLPLILVGLFNIVESDECTVSEWFPLAAGMAGVIMSHVVTAEMLVINTALLCVLLLRSLLKPQRISAMVKAMISCFLMTAWFVIPFIDSVIHQKAFVQTGDSTMLGETSQSWLSLLEIFAPGRDGRNYESLGLSLIAGIIVILYCLYCSNKRIIKENVSKATTISVLAIFAFINIVLASTYFPWDQVQNLLGIDKVGHQLGTIQFAWRFLSISAVLISFACVVALDYISNQKKRAYKASIIIISACIVLGCGYFYYITYDYADQIKASNIMSYTELDDLYYLEGTNDSIIYYPSCQVKEGEAEIDGYTKVSGKATLHVKNKSREQEAKVTVPIFAYDHYHVNTLEGDSVKEELVHDKDENNSILITVPAGYDGDIIIRFVEPISWRISEIISLFAWIIVSYNLIVRVKRRVKPE